ncbi:GTP 3',8-cyclase MoaA [Thermosipho atlanticus]|uniref:GTP 3',8-cyclase n=1 Tax=Thermosipho atlanticus DSM 15807 TaxID=1123380 RepID=A0A1M5T9G0_9BACT|nr:GTP 3',8-cyclase MoaA [Thermosipho atlanticus]SHH47415.1 cyclic pyranopterin phosphate synthase [Thermosipho atlanticus DSM 15807]
MIDKFKRNINYVRLSVTDKCNFRCNYCMDENAEFLPNDELLNLRQLETLIKVLKEMKIKHIRITGGEPTLRPDIVEIAKMLKKYFGNFSMTTNGSLLSFLLKDLKENGLTNINISLDSLNRETFRKITKRDDLKNVLEGLEKAVSLGMNVKINTVVQKINFNEIFDLIEFASKIEVPIRFIELMPVGNSYKEENFVSEDNLKSKIKEKYTLIPITKKLGFGPSRYFLIKELNSYIGFISAMTHNFCYSCNKIRISANGLIYPCLAFDYHISLKDVIHDEEKLKERIKFAINKKPEKHYFNEIEKTIPMHKMGG